MEDNFNISDYHANIQTLTNATNKLLRKVELLEDRLEKSELDNCHIIEKSIDVENELEELKLKDKLRETELKNARKEIGVLKKENEKLRNKIYRKNSRNSSIPPSQDPNRPLPNQSLREKSGKKPGGQKGHKGSTLEFVLNPTQTKDHFPTTCHNCGNELSSDLIFHKKRQIIDIPEILPDVTEHRTFKRSCNCGHCSIAPFPKNVKAPISYGPRTEAVIAYLSVRQYVPVHRIKEMFNQFFGINISAATICNKLALCSDKLLKYYSWIQKQIFNAPVLGSDETGCKVNGQKGWMWTWQSELFTFLRFSDNRGFKTISDTFPLGLPNSIVVHDCLSTQFKINAKGHQICTAHLLRELNFFIESGDKWSIKFKHKLKQALSLLKKIKLNPKICYELKIKKLNQQVDSLLNLEYHKKNKVATFIKRIKKRRDSLFRFLDDPSIPPDNNASERAIRNVKVKTKVSGMFKTAIGADQFAVIRSVIDTLSKRKQPVMKSLINMVS